MNSIIVWLLSLAVAAVYFKSSIQKLKNPIAFKQVIADYQVVKSPFLQLHFSLIVSTLEFIVAIALIIPSVRQEASYLGIGLQIIFIVMLLKNYGRHMENGCGCFELNTPKTITWNSVAINVAIVLALIVNLYFIVK